MITHQQAAQLRAQMIGRDDRLTRAGLSKIEIPSDDVGIGDLYPTPYGERMLAEYDAHFTTIEHVELERLQALERKIEVFLERMTAGNATAEPVEHGGVRVEWAKSGDEYGVWFVSRPGSGEDPLIFGGIEYYFDAMRKAFELFEVPGVEAKS